MLSSQTKSRHAGNNPFDFIAIGDITTDSFINLSKDDAEIIKGREGEGDKICLSFGDKIEYDSVKTINSVGNSPNAAVSAHRLGLKAALVTNLGKDELGEKSLKVLEKEGIAIDYIKFHEGLRSNHHYVLQYGAERTILINHEKYPYEMPDIGSPDWIYFSSLGEDSVPFHHELATYIQPQVLPHEI